jgi:hypothetical protein
LIVEIQFLLNLYELKEKIRERKIKKEGKRKRKKKKNRAKK